MLETKEQKRVFAVAITLVLILSVVSFWHRPKTVTTELASTKNAQKSFDYNAYFTSLNIDRQASEDMFKKVITEEEVRQEMEKTLDVDQTVTQPAISDKKLNVVAKAEPQTVKTYFQAAGQALQAYKESHDISVKGLFGMQSDAAALGQMAEASKSLTVQLYQVPVPKDIVTFHKALLANFETYSKLLELGESYAKNPDSAPWPSMYSDYLVINEQFKTVDSEYQKLDAKYNLAVLLKDSQKVARGNVLVPAAQAQIAVIDLKAVARDIAMQALYSSFANFAGSFLNKLIVKIESNFKVANYLYYSDALVRGQYVNDYLDKYVSDPVDRTMITNFIPQFNCGQSKDMRTAYKAKADQYLGFDASTLSPTDPDYYSKLARMGDFLASPTGWQMYYEDQAAQAEASAQKSVDRELQSSGLKTSRDLENSQIAVSVSSIGNTLRSSLQGVMDLGVNNAGNLVGQMATNLIKNLFSNFVFKGVVFQEQKSCVSTPQVNPIIPGV